MSIRFRSDRKTWEVSYVDRNGKRKRPQFDTKTEALAFRPADETPMPIEEPSNADSIKIVSALKVYYANVSSTKSVCSHKGEDRVFNLMGAYLTQVKGLTYLHEVRYGHMLALQNWMQKPMVLEGKTYKWAPSTVNRAFNSIKDFFVYWVRDEKLLSSPCAHLKHLEHEDNSRKPMTLEQFKLAHAKADPWFKSAMLFVYLTAAAPSTVERLKWSDVDFDRGIVTLTRRKGAKGRWRRIEQPMTEALVELLATQARRHAFVFSCESGKPLSAEWCSRMGNRAIKAAGVPGVLYCARHAMASDLTDANVNLEVIRQLMGHSNIRTTQRYAKPKSETLANALRLVRDEKVPPKCHQELEDVASGWQSDFLEGIK